MLESNIIHQRGKNFMTINGICRLFREQVLQITLQEMSNKTGVNLKTISAFENGRSKNIEHLQLYIKCCSDSVEEQTLVHNILLVSKGGSNE